MASRKTGTINDLFKMGGQPSSEIVFISSKGKVKEVVWLGMEFSHSYGDGRLWGGDDLYEKPVLLTICKRCGGNVQILDKLFYEDTGFNNPWLVKSGDQWEANPEGVIKKYDESEVSVQMVLPLFTKMCHWVRSSEAYHELVQFLEDNSDSYWMPPLMLRYLKEDGLEKDLSTLIGTMKGLSPEDKLYNEICF